MTEDSFPPSSSILGSKISNTGRILRDSAFSQINEYQNRFSKVAKLYELLFKDLLVTNFKNEDAYMTAKKLFGKDIVTFVAIDGTEYSRPLFDMIIFYAGAYSCEGTIHFSNNEDILVRYKNRFLDRIIPYAETGFLTMITIAYVGGILTLVGITLTIIGVVKRVVKEVKPNE